MKSLLFVIYEAGEFVELSRVAIAAKPHGYQSHFLFAAPHYKNLIQDRQICEKFGFTHHHISDSTKVAVDEKHPLEERLEDGYIPYSLVSPARPPKNRRISLFFVGIAAALLVGERLTKPFSRFFNRPAKLDQIAHGKAILDSVAPSLVIFGQEFPGSVNSVLISVCNTRGIPTLIVPFALGTTKEMVESLSDKPEYQADFNAVNKLAAHLYPAWVNYYRGKRLLRLRGISIFMLEAFGIAPEHPWIPNSSKVTALAVESVAMQRYYQRMRFPDEQLRLTGSFSDDVLTKSVQRRDTIRAQVVEDLGLDPLKPILLCAWPTDQYGSRKSQMEFQTYSALCRAWAEALALARDMGKFNIVIRPHPVTDPDLLFLTLSRYNLSRSVTMRDTAELVGISDLFVACVSSTLRWAISSGIPAINYDCYKYGYTDFESGATWTVNTHSDFKQILSQLTESREFLDQARAKQQAAAPDWGFRDGGSGQRILALINNLTGHSSLGAQCAKC